MAAATLSQSQYDRRRDSTNQKAFVRMFFGLALTMVPFVLVVVVALFMGPFFLYCFPKFPIFCVQI